MRSLSNMHVNTLREHGRKHCNSRLLSQQPGLQPGKQPLFSLFSVCMGDTSVFTFILNRRS